MPRPARSVGGLPWRLRRERYCRDHENLHPDEEKLGLVDLLKRTIDEDRYPLSPRILTFKAILAKLEPESVPSSPYPAPNEHFASSGTPGVLGALPGYARSWCRCARLLDTEKAASGASTGLLVIYRRRSICGGAGCSGQLAGHGAVDRSMTTETGDRQ